MRRAFICACTILKQNNEHKVIIRQRSFKIPLPTFSSQLWFDSKGRKVCGNFNWFSSKYIIVVDVNCFALELRVSLIVIERVRGIS